MLTFLLVDDEQHIREGITAAAPWDKLQIDQVLQAVDGEQALEIAKNYKIDVLLTDIRMPRMNGIELSKKVRMLYPDCIIVFMSAYSDKEYLLSAIQLKCNNFVEKPLNVSQVVDVISDSVREYSETENKRLRNIMFETSMRISIPLITNEIAVMVTNRHADMDLLRECAGNELLEIDLNTAYITVILQFFCEDETRRNRQKDRGLLNDLARIIRSNGFKCFYGTRDDKEFLIHISSQYENASNINQARVEQLLREWADGIGCQSFFLTIGETAPDFMRICDSYASAKAALSKCFFRGYGSIVGYSPEITKSSLLENGFVGRFSEALELGQQKLLSQMLRDLCDQLKKYENMEIDEIRNFFYRLLLTVQKRIQMYGSADIPDNANENLLRNSISGFRTLGELNEYALQYLSNYFDIIKKMSGASNITTIISFIEKNYNESSLDINRISQSTFLSPAYLCTYFKKETGRTINQYITEYRLNKSTEFLKDKKYKISDVAGLTGYDDGNYFTRLFRKKFGISPSEYRERLGMGA
jgi:Response regulator containing CheY-like receiver domain and AraC-type DNA-binding domain